MTIVQNMIACTVAVAMMIGCDTPKNSVAESKGPLQVVTLGDPVLELGVNDELERVASAVRLENGSIVVADAFSANLRYFDSTGKQYRSVGRSGEGPKEFRTPGWIGRCQSDSLFVFDPTLIRFTVLDSAGQVARHFTTPRLTMLTCRDGIIAGFTAPTNMRMPDPKGPRQRVRAQIQFFDTKGETRAVVDSVPLGELGPLSRVSSLALTDGRLWLGTADSAYLDIFSIRGKRTGGVTLDIPRIKATKSHWTADIEQQLSGTKDKQLQESNRTLMEKFAVPDYLPAYKQIGADPRGGVWIANVVPGDGTTTLRIVSKGGRITTSINLNRSVRVLEVGKDYILATYEVDGQPRVGMYSLDLEPSALTP